MQEIIVICSVIIIIIYEQIKKLRLRLKYVMHVITCSELKESKSKLGNVIFLVILAIYHHILLPQLF